MLDCTYCDWCHLAVALSSFDGVAIAKVAHVGVGAMQGYSSDACKNLCEFEYVYQPFCGCQAGHCGLN